MSAESAHQRAERYLDTAQLVLEAGDYESSVSRSYYAMFYMVRALLNRHGLSAKTHSGTFTLFSLHFVKEGPVPASLARAYQEALDTREFAEYAEEFVITEADATDVLADAEEFVAFLADLLD